VLSADVGATPAELPALASGTLTANNPQSTTFTMTQTDQAHFVLSAAGASGSATMVVTDASGNVMATVTAAVDRGRSADVFLAAGTYTVTIQTSSNSTINYQAVAAVVTDPVGVTPPDPTTNPAPTDPPPTDTSLPPAPPPPPPPPPPSDDPSQ
jgi:hypothetical protein